MLLPSIAGKFSHFLNWLPSFPHRNTSRSNITISNLGSWIPLMEGQPMPRLSSYAASNIRLATFFFLATTFEKHIPTRTRWNKAFRLWCRCRRQIFYIKGFDSVMTWFFQYRAQDCHGKQAARRFFDGERDRTLLAAGYHTQECWDRVQLTLVTLSFGTNR